MVTEPIDRARASGSEGTPADQLAAAARKTVELTVGRLLASVDEKVTNAAQRLTTYAEGGAAGAIPAAAGAGVQNLAKGLIPGAVKAGVSAIPEKVKEKVGSLRGEQKLKFTTIVEQIDVGVPVELAYDQWTRFTDFPSFMKKVERVEQESDVKTTWKAQVFWSHRTWESTIIEQVPDERIVWRSKGDKGYVDGAVTFHDLTPDLTRIILVLEYHPKGLFERTANLWRAQGRRARLELQHFQRHVMTHAVLHPDEIEGWRGEIHGGEVADTSEGENEDIEDEARPADRDQDSDEETRTERGATR